MTTVMFKPSINEWNTSNWCDTLKRFFEKHGHPNGVEKIQSHCFRVTRATNMYEKHKDVARVQKYLGHAKIETTMKYIKVNQMFD